HIDNQYHFIRDQVERGLLKVKGVRGQANLADPLMKLLPKPAMVEWKKRLRITNRTLG
ncbi:hypothetical protein BDZ91DRAFT_670142, partial [Kalaharituber pfeilii]